MHQCTLFEYYRSHLPPTCTIRPPYACNAHLIKKSNRTQCNQKHVHRVSVRTLAMRSTNLALAAPPRIAERPEPAILPEDTSRAVFRRSCRCPRENALCHGDADHSEKGSCPTTFPSRESWTICSGLRPHCARCVRNAVFSRDNNSISATWKKKSDTQERH